MSITDFLNARIAEDEAMAREYQQYEEEVYETAGWFNCTRVLAECAAKRAIVELHQPYEIAQRMTYGDIHPCMTCGSVDDSPEPFPCPTVRTLAAVYADHPAYLDEWRVGA